MLRAIVFALSLLLAAAAPAEAATRYWVGGSGTWQAGNTTHWSTSSGGSGGATAPGSSDACVFDGSSGGGTVTVLNSVVCQSLNMSAWAGTLAASSTSDAISIQGGNVTLSAGTAWSGSGGPYLSVTNTGLSTTFTSNGATIGPTRHTPSLILDGLSGGFGSLLLGDDLAVVGTVQIGDLVNLSGNDVSATAILVKGLSGATAILGSGTITVTGTGTVWSCCSNSGLNASSSTIVINNASTLKTFTGGGKTYNNLTVANAGVGGLLFSDGNTFSTLTFAAGSQISFTSGSTTKATTLVWTGTSLSQTKLVASTGGSPWTISVASGTVSQDYLFLQDSTAMGGATFYAGAHSTNAGGNSGWIFSAPTPMSLSKMFAVFP